MNPTEKNPLLYKRADILERIYTAFGKVRTTIFSELQGSSDVGDPEHEAELEKALEDAANALELALKVKLICPYCTRT